MQQILLVVHLMIAIALVISVLIQRSEGGGLGIGGGANMGAVRGSGSTLTRLTGILAACFMATSLILAILASGGSSPGVLVPETVPPLSTSVPPLEAPVPLD